MTGRKHEDRFGRGPDFQLIGLAAIAAFEVANKQAGETLYQLDVLSEEGGLVTSSSVGMIERDHGSELARAVAKSMVMYHRRSGGSPSIPHFWT